METKNWKAMTLNEACLKGDTLIPSWNDDPSTKPKKRVH
jgi:hypothetical protein